MQNTKLQELTDKLYQEGLQKGQDEGAAILAKAKEEAQSVISKAKEEAQAIIAQARKDAEAFKVKTEGDVKLASGQAVQTVRKSIEDIIIAKTVQTPAKAALTDADFVKEILKTVAEKFSADGATDLQAVLPESLRSQIEPYISGELTKVLKGGLTATFSKKLSGGFNIGPKDGSYFISFSDEALSDLLGDYLRPATKKLLFG